MKSEIRESENVKCEMPKKVKMRKNLKESKIQNSQLNKEQFIEITKVQKVHFP